MQLTLQDRFSIRKDDGYETFDRESRSKVALRGLIGYSLLVRCEVAKALTGSKLFSRLCVLLNCFAEVEEGVVG